ncbi:hypothetical protein GFS31_40110 [Leptolyngbya sp. BL0902]|uniref:helix-turn-helix domain-containing protein n=1 Tax=Leptolyngbya sp. BL0902 TaxID=1115757 RepID=UPI0018E8D50D|nr:helix-turn-helix domain-containing protein [Leptolyngbya sp. BL0902]QQE67298.1 hypothetical protein GFS31_40110 [Leptolyngbya sp. BL0902]
MTNPQPPQSNLTTASEYALILGSGAAAVASVATQQVAAASLPPLAALVALGLINRYRLDQQLQQSQSAGQPLDTDTTQGRSLSSVPPRMVANLRPEHLAHRPQILEPPISSVSFSFSPPQHSIAGPLAAKRQAQANLDARMSANLRQVGDELRQHRQAKGWSVEEVYTRTFIQPYIVNAIEAGNVRQLPEPFYIRAFLQKYATALGLDGVAVAKRFADA